MKKISLLAALLVAGVSSAVAESFNGGYVGATLGLKATRAGAFDTGSMGATNPEKLHLKRKGLTGGLSLGWGGEVAPNFYLGLHIDFFLGSGSKKVEKKGKTESSLEQGYVPAAGSECQRGMWTGYGGNIAHSAAYDPSRGVDIPFGASQGDYNQVPAGSRILWLSGVALAGGVAVGHIVPVGGGAIPGNHGLAIVAAPGALDLKQTISVKDRATITTLIQAGYLFKAALAGKDVLVYGEVGPHIAFTRLSLESKITTPGLFRLSEAAAAAGAAAGAGPISAATIAPEAFDGALEKTQKSSVGVGIALGTGVKVAVSNNLVVSLGYRFTKIPGNSVKATFGDNGLKKVKIPMQSHTILVGLNYAF